MMKKISESNIRRALISQLKDCFDGSIFEEVKVEGGSARVDVAAFGDQITGYEIKSDFDNFDRLSNQIHAYNRAFGKIYIVCSERHLELAMTLLPSWWGIKLAAWEQDSVQIQEHRKAKHHKRQDPYSTASLIDKHVGIELLRQKKLSINSKASQRKVWEAIANSMKAQEIEEAVVKYFNSHSIPNTVSSDFDLVSC